jgi:hypothetical protein
MLWLFPELDPDALPPEDGAAGDDVEFQKNLLAITNNAVPLPTQFDNNQVRLNVVLSTLMQ